MTIRRCLLAVLALAVIHIPVASADTLKLISVGLNNQEPSEAAEGGRISRDGRFVVFQSYATNLVAGDTNGTGDIFLYDVNAQTLSRLSRGLSGQESNAASSNPAISATGRYIAFGSDASNLVAGDTNAASDCFLLDRESGTTTRVSVGNNGEQGDSSSCQGLTPAVSADGRYVAFHSHSTNLVPGDSNGLGDIFVRDTVQNTTTRVSVASDGSQANGQSQSLDMSGDGKMVAFFSQASNLAGAADSNSAADVFVRNMSTSETVLASRTAGGASGNGGSGAPRVSFDGRYVTFSSIASNLAENDTNGSYDTFIFDLTGARVTLMSGTSGGEVGDAGSQSASLNSNGGYGSFNTASTNLIPADANGDYDCYLADIGKKTFRRVSVQSDGSDLGGDCFEPDISGDGHLMVFSHTAPFSTGIGINAMTPTYVYLAELDLCPEDPGKLVAGLCGCGVPDTDSDSDGTVDCLEECDQDPAKTSPGACGCGTSDADLNGNGNEDCIDPNALTIPARPRLTYRKGKLSVSMQAYPGAHVLYQATASAKIGGKRTAKRKTSSVNSTAFKKLPAGAWTVTYTVAAGSVTSKPSVGKKIRVRP